MKICLIVKPGYPDSGVGRYAAELEKHLRRAGVEVVVAHPSVPLPGWLLAALKKWPGWDLAAFFNNYPLWIRYPAADLYHFTSQNLATLLIWRQPPGPSVVTVHDLIPWLARIYTELEPTTHRAARWFDGLAMRGMEQTQGTIAITDFTKDSLVSNLNFHENEIHVVHQGL